MLLNAAALTHSSGGAARLRPLTWPQRTVACVVACVVCLLFIFVGIFSPLIVLRDMDKRYATDMRGIEYKLANIAVAPFRNAMVEAYGISQALEGYVLRRMTTLPDLSAPPGQRVEGQHFANFDDVGRTLRRNTTMIPMVALQPGGVYGFTSPPNSTMDGRDVLDPNDNAQNYVPTPLETIECGCVVVVGPLRSTLEVLAGKWGVGVRRPIFNRTTYAVHDVSTFWGFAYALVNVSGILATRPFDFRALDEGRSEVDYMLTTTDLRTRAVEVIETSLHKPTPERVNAFMRAGTSVNVTPNHPFTITIRGRHYGRHLSANNITVVVSTVVFGLLLVLAAVLAMLLWCRREYDAARYAPKMAPFAMLTIGPCRGEQLWDSAPEEMAEVVARLDDVLQRRMVRHHAYPIQQVHPLTTSYVTRSVAAAVQMAFDAIEQLQRHPIDAPLRAALGDADGRLLLSYAVHWCTDAAVRVESLQGSYRYEGPDVVFGGRMWAFAAPGVVTASAAVVAALPRFGLRCVAARPHRVVHVVRSRTRCGATDATGTAADTIYVPPPAPTAVQATAGMCAGRSASLGTAAALAAFGGDSVDGHSDDAQPLFTLMDARRPELLAAEAAAPRNVDGFGAVPELRGVQRRSLTLVDVPATVAGGAVAAGATLGDPYVSSRSLSSVADDAHGLPSGTDRSLMSPLPAFVLSTLTHRTSASLRTPNGGALEGDAVTRALLQPIIPRSLDVALHTAFDYQAITLNMHYTDVRVLVYYFYSSYKILFRPLAAPERHNIFRRLVTAFGVPQQGILEHLAARCVLRGLQRGIKAQHAATHPLKQRLSTTLPPPLAAFTETPNDAALTRKAGRR